MARDTKLRIRWLHREQDQIEMYAQNLTAVLGLFAYFSLFGLSIHRFLFPDEKCLGTKLVLSFGLGLTAAVLFVIVLLKWLHFNDAILGGLIVGWPFIGVSAICFLRDRKGEYAATLPGVSWWVCLSVLTLLGFVTLALHTNEAGLGHVQYIFFTGLLENDVWPLTWPASPYGGDHPSHIFYLISFCIFNRVVEGVSDQALHIFLTVSFLSYAFAVAFVCFSRFSTGLLAPVLAVLLFFFGDFTFSETPYLSGLRQQLTTGRMSFFFCFFLFLYGAWFLLSEKNIRSAAVAGVLGVATILNDEAKGHILLFCLGCVLFVPLVHDLFKGRNKETALSRLAAVGTLCGTYVVAAFFTVYQVVVTYFLGRSSTVLSETPLTKDVDVLFQFSHLFIYPYGFQFIGLNTFMAVAPMFYFLVLWLIFSVAHKSLQLRQFDIFYIFSFVFMFVASNNIIIAFDKQLLQGNVALANSMATALGGIVFAHLWRDWRRERLSKEGNGESPAQATR